nr:hypothetical protein CFP56_31441 [Quercus suber]
MHSKRHYFSFYSKWLSEFTSANNSLVGDLISVRPTHQKPRVCWSPPPTNLFKISFDGAVIKDGDVEAMAAAKALEFALDIGISKAILEGDSEHMHETAVAVRGLGLGSGTHGVYLT